MQIQDAPWLPAGVWPVTYELGRSVQHCDAIRQLEKNLEFHRLNALICGPDSSSAIFVTPDYTSALNAADETQRRITEAQIALGTIVTSVAQTMLGATVAYAPRLQDSDTQDKNVWFSDRGDVVEVPDKMPPIEMDQAQLRGMVTYINFQLGVVGLRPERGTSPAQDGHQINVRLFRLPNGVLNRAIVATGRLNPTDRTRRIFPYGVFRLDKSEVIAREKARLAAAGLLLQSAL